MVVSLVDLRRRVRERADQQHSLFVGPEELDGYIQGSYEELYDLITSRFEDYHVLETVFNVGPDGIYPLPEDFYKVRGVDVQIGGGDDGWLSVRKWMFAERNRINRFTNRIAFGVNNVTYRAVGNNLHFLPQSQAAGLYRLWYIPKCPQLSETQGLDGVNGWEEYVIVDAAIKCLTKEEADTATLQLAKQQLRDRIEAMAANRDAGEAERVTDVTSNFSDYPWRGDYW